MKNTLQKGSVRNIIFREGNMWFGVALEFNIVESGDDPREVMIMLDEAIKGYVESAQKSKLRPHILNQETDPEYEKLWKLLESNKQIPTPYQVHSFSRTIISA